MSRWTLWGILLRINKLIEALYNAITRPLRKYFSRLTIRLPFSHFYFRPLFLGELYMALGLWEPYVRKNLALNKGDIFIDIGAHIGHYTLCASRKVGESGSVIAIEPDPRSLSVLYKNLRAAKADNTTVLEAAAGFNGSLYLSPHEEPGATSTTKRKEYHEQREVRSISLDTLIESVSLSEQSNITIKIDVEGGEVDVTRGGLSFIKRYHPTLIVESWKLPQLQEALEEVGYSYCHLFSTYHRFSPVDKP